MFRATIKNLRAHKLRVLLTSAIVVVGVSFMAGTMVLTDTMTNSFNGLFNSLYKDTDAVVRAEKKLDTNGGPNQQRPEVPADLVQTLAEVDGVKAAEGSVSANGVQFVGKDGKAMGNPGFGAPSFGFSWSTVHELNPYTIVEGHPPSGATEVVADKASATKGGFKVGDQVKVTGRNGTKEFELVGIAKFGDSDSPLGASTAFFDQQTAQSFVGQAGKFNSIGLVAKDGVSQDQLVEKVKAVVPRGDEVLSGASFTKEQQDQVAQGLSFFGIFMTVFAVIALIVGSFIIYNTFSIVVAQRTKELALFRAIGASRSQVRRSVLIEAIVTGLIASTLGLAGGVFFSVLLKGLLSAAGLSLPSSGVAVTPRSLLIAFVVGVVVTVVAATIPAFKAAKVPPIAAMRDVSIDRTNASLGRIIAGTVVTLLGVASLFLGLFVDIENRIAFVGLGALLTFLGVAVLGPVYAKPLARLLGGPVSAVKGITGRLARQNSSRNPRRTSATASALMVGVGLVCALAVLSTSAKQSYNELLEKNFTGDFVLSTGGFGGNGFSPELAQKVRALPELDAVAAMRAGPAKIADKPEPFVAAIDAAETQKVFDPEVKAGNFADLDQPGTIAVNDKYAADKGWAVGTMIPATFAEDGDTQLRLVATYGRGDLLGQTVLGIPTWEQHSTTQSDFQVFTKLEKGANAAQARADIEKVAADYPTAKVLDITEYKAASTGPVDVIFGLMTVLLFFAVVIAMFGIMITLLLSVYERTREIGLLRAVGMTRRQARTTIRWESVIIAVFGTALGLGIGLFFGWAIVKSLVDQGITMFVVPVAWIVFLLVFAIIFGILMAIWPAYRASKLDVLRALATE